MAGSKNSFCFYLSLFFLHWKKVFVADKSDVFLFCFFELWKLLIFNSIICHSGSRLCFFHQANVALLSLEKYTPYLFPKSLRIFSSCSSFSACVSDICRTWINRFAIAHHWFFFFLQQLLGFRVFVFLINPISSHH